MPAFCFALYKFLHCEGNTTNTVIALAYHAAPHSKDLPCCMMETEQNTGEQNTGWRYMIIRNYKSVLTRVLVKFRSYEINAASSLGVGGQ